MIIRGLLLLFALSVFIPATVLAETNTVSSTVVTDKTPPTASAPSVVINNTDVCKSAKSAAVQTQILGISMGTTITEENCVTLKRAKTLYDMGMKVAAVSVMCAGSDQVFDAMMNAGTPCPYNGMIGDAAKEAWESDQLTADVAMVSEKTGEANDDTAKGAGAVAGVLGLLLLL